MLFLFSSILLLLLPVPFVLWLLLCSSSVSILSLFILICSFHSLILRSISTCELLNGNTAHYNLPECNAV
jgi:hypothetical protein